MISFHEALIIALRKKDSTVKDTDFTKINDRITVYKDSKRHLTSYIYMKNCLNTRELIDEAMKHSTNIKLIS